MISLQQSQQCSSFQVLNEDEQPEDSISGLSWGTGSQSQSFACCAWDSTVRLYDVITDGTPQVKQKTCVNVEYPCVSVSLASDSGKILAGSIDGSVLQIDTQNGAITSFPIHTDAVKDVYWLEREGIILSVSYDKTLSARDPREQSGNIARLEAKVLCSCLSLDYLVMGMSNSKVKIGKIRDILAGPSTSFCTSDSPFEVDEQITSVALGEHDLTRFKVGIGSSFGNINVSLYESRTYGEVPLRSQGTFRAHKSYIPPSVLNVAVHSVQALGFLPTGENSLYSMGAEGAGYIWNHQSKKKLQGLGNHGIPITKAQLRPDGQYIAYGIGYDWSQGIEGAQKYKTKLFVKRL